MQMIWFCDESEEGLKVMEGRFVEVYRRVLKVNAKKSKVMVVCGESKIHEDEARLEQVLRIQIFGVYFR